MRWSDTASSGSEKSCKSSFRGIGTRASWQPNPDAPAETFHSEDGPGWNEIEDAIEWARSRAPVVRSASVKARGRSTTPETRRRRPTPDGALAGNRGGTAGNVHPDYGGVVYVDEEHLVFVPTGRFSAVWGSESGELLEESDELFEDLEAAVDWGRKRAPVVLVAELPLSWSHIPAYEIRSAGDRDPPGDPLERLRPRRGHETMEWSFTTQEAVSETEPHAFSRELEEALRNDDTVRDPVCRVLDEHPRIWSQPAPVTADDLEPPIQGWVDVSFRVSAPTRKRAFELAITALHRARDSGEETVHGLMGTFTLHAAS